MMNNCKNKKLIVIVFLIDFLATREGVTGGTERQIVDIINRCFQFNLAVNIKRVKDRTG